MNTQADSNTSVQSVPVRHYHLKLAQTHSQALDCFLLIFKTFFNMQKFFNTRRREACLLIFKTLQDLSGNIF